VKTTREKEIEALLEAGAMESATPQKLVERDERGLAVARIAVAVIERALLDAQAGDVEAREYLERGDEDLAFWCAVVGIDPASLRDRWPTAKVPLAT